LSDTEQKAAEVMHPLVTYGALFAAIVFEVIGTSFLQQTNQWTRLVPTLCMGASYAVAFYLLSITLTTMPVGIAYAIWSGLGIVLISLVGLVVFKQSLDVPAVIGLGLIVAGVIVVNVFSSSVRH
jgi:small multidrug resistance pump